MKSKLHHATGLVTLSLVLPAAADIIYGSLQQTITTDYTGVSVTVGDGTLNPFFGGAGVANNNNLQPFRLAATGLSTIKDFATGVFINSGSGSLATGAGGSIDHLGAGGTFTAGTEGYVGFKLDGANYGWMRVVLTNNTSTPVTPVVKDWAYDTTGAAIKTGWINTDVVSGTAQTVTLNPDTGESFTLGSQLANASGSITNSVVKTGAGTAVLTGTNSYGGSTTVSNGTLLVNGSVTGGGTVSVTSGATLGGTGSITGPVIVNGILSPGASIESLATGALTFNGGTFTYEMNSGAGPSVAADFQKVFGDLALNGTVTLDLTDLASTPTAFAPATTLSLINYAGSWNGGFFTCAGNELGNHEVFTAGLNTWRINYDAISGGLNFASEYTSGHFVTLTAVPEPGSWLALGCLIGSGTFLRRRVRVG